MTNRYFVTDDNGRVHTRNTTRTYTHVVLYRLSKEAALRLAERKDRFLADNFWHHHGFVDGTSKWLVRAPWEKDDAQYKRRVEKDVARSHRALRGTKSPEEWYAALRDEALARIDRINYDIWHAEGWCGRLDLAQKLAHKVNCRETVAEAIILPVEIRTF
jgi:hypothetical protein